jgi:undecaprenyl-diphosphatase
MGPDDTMVPPTRKTRPTQLDANHDTSGIVDDEGHRLPTPSLRGFTALGLVTLAALVVLVASLDGLVVFDDRVWRTVLMARGCTTDRTVDVIVDQSTRALVVLLIGVTIASMRRRGVASVWPWVMTCVLGLFASKTLKHLLTRQRPSTLADVAFGYSFPSAHVMNSMMAMMAVIVLTHGFRRRSLWCVLAGVLTAIVTMGRVLLGHHWACDTVGGVLAALTLVGLAVPAFTRRPVVAPVLALLALAVAFAVDHRMGDAGLRLPAPLIGRNLALVDVDVGADRRSELGGNWRESAEERSVGSLVWLEGSGVVPLEMTTASTEPFVLAWGSRMERVQPSCLTLDVAVNGRPVGRFVPFAGWREYRLPLAPGVLHAGRNEVGFSAATREGPARLAVTYVRVGRRSAQ